MATHMPNGRILLTLYVLGVLNIMVTDIDAHTNRVLKIRFGCERPPHVPNAFINEPGTRTVGSTRTYSCDEGYLSYPAYVNMDITCTGGLVWTNPLFTCDAPEIINLALGKKTSQNGEYAFPEFVPNASLAVDGNTNGDFFNGQTCTHTATTIMPWWKVDLGDIHRITHVTVFNRKDCCSDRLSNFHLYFGYNEVVFPGTVGDSHTFQLGTATFGGYLRILLKSSNYLTLCEVQVFGEREPVRFDFVAGQVGTAVYSTRIEASNIDCIANCRISWCFGVNFHPDDGTCELLKAVASSSTTTNVQFYTNPFLK